MTDTSKQPRWTEEEERILIEQYEAIGPEGCAKLLPLRTEAAISCHVTQMRIRGVVMRPVDPFDVAPSEGQAEDPEQIARRRFRDADERARAAIFERDRAWREFAKFKTARSRLDQRPRRVA